MWEEEIDKLTKEIHELHATGEKKDQRIAELEQQLTNAQGSLQIAAATNAGAALKLEKRAVDAENELAELRRSFDLRYAADMRAIKMWQERSNAEPGDDMVWPDHADLCVWLLEQLDASPRHAPVPETGHIIRRCEKCHGVTEVPDKISLVGIVSCRACAAEAAIKDLQQQLDHAKKCADGIEASHKSTLDLYCDRTAEADRLRVRSEALEMLVLDIRTRTEGFKQILQTSITLERIAALQQAIDVVRANGGRSVQDIIAQIEALA